MCLSSDIFCPFRPDLDKLKIFLKELGATEVITEEGLASREMIRLLTVRATITLCLHEMCNN